MGVYFGLGRVLMLPTSYLGDATINGERMSAELELGTDNVRLKIAAGEEVVSWPIRSLDVEAAGDGSYQLLHGTESFSFAPNVDDGLGEEIALRRRFAPGEVIPTTDSQGEKPVKGVTVADRVRSARHAHPGRGGLLDGKDLGLRTALVVLAILALAVVAVAALSGEFRRGGQTVTVNGGPAPSTLPTEASPATGIPQTQQPTVSEEPPVTVTPPTVAGVTVTAAPTTTVPPPPQPATIAVFESTPEDLVAAWDDAARAVLEDEAASGLETGGGSFSFDFGEFARVEGDTANGVIQSLRFIGDPSGRVEDDRMVMIGLGITVAVVEPTLTPDGRRELLASLGLDIEDPILDGLDGSLEYRGIAYGLRWDGDIERIVFEAEPAGTETEQS